MIVVIACTELYYLAFIVNM